LNLSTGVLIAGPKEFVGSFRSLAVSPSITKVAVAVEGQMLIWDTLTEKVAGSITDRDIRAIIFSSDGKYVTSLATDYSLCVSDCSSGEAVRGPVELRDPQKYQFGTHYAAMTLDGRKVAFTGINGTILLCDVLYEGDSDVVLQCSSVLAGHSINAVESLTFSRDGQHLVSIYDGTIWTWDLQATLEHKRVIENLTSDDPEVFNFNETQISTDGWAICKNGDDADLPLRQLFWVPEIHRNDLHRSSNMCVVGSQRETRLDLENFVHGRKWAKCWRGLEHS